MSTLKVNAIRQTSATSDAVTLASDGTCTAKITNNLSNRNLIVNGAMNVAQRGTSDTTDAQQFTTVDRWRITWSGLEEQVSKYQEQLSSSDTGPWEKGFRNAWKLQNGNQTGGADANGYINPQMAVEAQDIASSGWVHTDPNSKITLSFWVKSSVAQTFYAYVRSMDGTSQSYPISYAVLANTWTKVTKTIPGHANVQIDNNNDAGLYLFFPLFLGTDRTASGVSLNAWGAYSGSARTPDSTTTWYTTNDATWHMTGIQLEVGDVATDFEHRLYGDELRRCQRYFYMLADGSTSSQALADGRFLSTSEVDFMIRFPVTMRSTPSIYQVTGGNYFKIMYNGSGSAYNNYVDGNWTLQYAHRNGTSHYATPDATGSADMPAQVIANNTSARLGYQAEI